MNIGLKMVGATQLVFLFSCFIITKSSLILIFSYLLLSSNYFYIPQNITFLWNHDNVFSPSQFTGWSAMQSEPQQTLYFACGSSLFKYWYTTGCKPPSISSGKMVSGRYILTFLIFLYERIDINIWFAMLTTTDFKKSF